MTSIYLEAHIHDFLIHRIFDKDVEYLDRIVIYDYAHMRWMFDLKTIALRL